eukprot:6261676-Alexandrium_andersonii.AAC.1
MPKRRASAIPGPCCTEPKGVDALAGGLCGGTLTEMPGGRRLGGDALRRGHWRCRHGCLKDRRWRLGA